MAQVTLTGGFYKARSLIANAQRCVNLYPEANQPDAPAPTTHYLTPGLVSITMPGAQGPGRGMYVATNGKLFVVVGQNLYYVTSSWTWQLITALTTSTGMVGMKDNGLVLAVVDGTVNGLIVDLTTLEPTTVNVAGFFGSRAVGYIDTYFTFTRPGTNQFYITTSNLIFSDANNGPISSGSVTAGGAGYLDGVYPNTPLTGGSGTGAIGTVTVVGNTVTGVSVTSAGNGYEAGDVLSASLRAIGTVTAISLVSPGQNLTPGTYLNRPTVAAGGGSGMTVNVTVGPFGAATSLTLVSGGLGYIQGNGAFTTNIPGVSPPTPPGEPPEAVLQVQFRIVTVTGSASGFQYTVGSIVSSNTVNPLDIAAKTGFPDKIVNHICVHREAWLVGEYTTEVWYNTGAPDFTFGPQPGVFIEHGCLAPYSLATTDLTPIWLAQDRDGRAFVVQGIGYQAKRISTHAIENAIQKYSRLDDAVAFVYQQEGHTFYVLNFPTADSTWCFDLATQLWHERVWTDAEGLEHRARPIAYANAYGLDLVQDWETGEIYRYDLDVYTDAGRPIVRRRSFPHLKNEMKRVLYAKFIADISSGDQLETMVGQIPQVNLRWSDDGGKSWSSAMAASMGTTGQFNTCPQWTRLGLGRDRVFELFWSADVKTALNCAYVDVVPAGS